MFTISEIYELSYRIERIALDIAVQEKDLKHPAISEMMKLVYELRDEADMLDREMENEYCKLEEQE